MAAPPVFKVSDAHIDTPVGKAMQEIRDALQDKDTPPEELTKKIDAFKEALDKAKAEVAAAQKDLKDALTPPSRRFWPRWVLSNNPPPCPPPFFAWN